jgi:GNAT superfamily N-acetyltransferase
MLIRPANLTDKDTILSLLDEFRADCMEQATGQPAESHSARTKGATIFETLLARSDYALFLLTDENSQVVGIITGYLCPMLRSGQMRAEVEEFFIKKENRGGENAKLLMDAFFEWCQTNHVQKVNLESDNALHRAHGFYTKYGFETKAVRFVKKLDS